MHQITCPTIENDSNYLTENVSSVTFSRYKISVKSMHYTTVTYVDMCVCEFHWNGIQYCLWLFRTDHFEKNAYEFLFSSNNNITRKLSYFHYQSAKIQLFSVILKLMQNARLVTIFPGRCEISIILNCVNFNRYSSSRSYYALVSPQCNDWSFIDICLM